jgi:signal transduction histidine kinase
MPEWPALPALASVQDRTENRLVRRGGLFLKYAIPLVILVSGALIVSGLVGLYFSYQESKAALARIQHEKALAAAIRIEQFVRELEHQLAWVAQTPWGPRAVPIDQRRLDSLRLLRQAPAITEVSHIDPSGHEQLRVSRLAMDVVGSKLDLSQDPKFREALAHKVYFSPVYFRKESEPYMTIALAGTGEDAGVVAAEANLKLIWDVVSNLKVGKGGYAYVVDNQGRLIAHPDISLVLKKTDLSVLPQVQLAASTGPGAGDALEGATLGRDQHDKEVLSASARITPLNWLVLVDLPISEAFAPLYASVIRTAVLLLVGILISVAASLLLMRRLVRPIHTLQAGASKIGAGALDHRIDVRTGDELQALGDEFNRMAKKLQEYTAGLEQKVEERTRELARSVEQLRSLAEVGQAVNSTLDLEQVLTTIVTRAVQLSSADGGLVYELDEASGRLQPRAAIGVPAEIADALANRPLTLAESIVGRAAAAGAPVEIPDIVSDPTYYTGRTKDTADAAGMRALLAVPLLREDRILGGLLVSRNHAGSFPPETVDVLQTFAAQSTLAMQNARLFREIEVKGRELEIASRHKSQFLANMSHELRTPLNAILGYTELIVDRIYGELPEKVSEVLERVQKSGRHLLGLINDVLDLSKIEAGQLALAVDDYSFSDVVQSVVSAVGSLAAEKQLPLKVNVARDLPVGRGDERRITQVLLNLVGNAIKFTEAGEVAVRVVNSGGAFVVSVTDTGPGIREEDQQKIFEEFQQSDSSSTKTKGGTGLGLAIAKRIVEMHGGRIWLESSPGKGATFFFSVPVRAEQEAIQL